MKTILSRYKFPSWRPKLAIVTEGGNQYLKIIDWEGGIGTKPTKNLYIGSNGLTIKVNEAVALNFEGKGSTSFATSEQGAKADTAIQPDDLDDYYSKLEADSLLSNKADVVNGKIPESLLPSYVDSIQEETSITNFPSEGVSNVIYLDTTTNIPYRWGGTTYVPLNSSLALGETSSTAYRGDRGKTAYDHTLLEDNPHNTTKEQVGLGNVDNTSDINKPLSTLQKEYIDSKLSTGSLIATKTVVDGWAVWEYSDRIEYKRKIPFSYTVGTGNNRYATHNTGVYSPEGINIANADEHYLSLENKDRTASIAVHQSASNEFRLGTFNNYSSTSSPSGSVFVKLVRYK